MSEIYELERHIEVLKEAKRIYCESVHLIQSDMRPLCMDIDILQGTLAAIKEGKPPWDEWAIAKDLVEKYIDPDTGGTTDEQMLAKYARYLELRVIEVMHN